MQLPALTVHNLLIAWVFIQLMCLMVVIPTTLQWRKLRRFTDLVGVSASIVLSTAIMLISSATLAVALTTWAKSPLYITDPQTRVLIAWMIVVLAALLFFAQARYMIHRHRQAEAKDIARGIFAARFHFSA